MITNNFVFVSLGFKVSYDLMSPLTLFSFFLSGSVPPLEEDKNSVFCDESLCRLREAGDEAVRDVLTKNGKIPRPKCSNIPGMYWDQMDCSDSGIV